MTSLLRTNRFSDGNLLSMLPQRDDLFYPFQQVFDKFYDELLSDGNSIKSRVGFPRWDIWYDDNQWVVEVGCSGMGPEDVKVEIIPEKNGNRRMLKISGQMSDEHKAGDGVTFHAKELRRSAFERCVWLPDYVKGDPQAVMKDGILKLSWTKPPELRGEVKQIPVKSWADPENEIEVNK
jgi:HSP20 family molecular chaperone IbpA